MKRVEYLDGSKTRLTRAFLGLQIGGGALGERAVELYLPTQSVLSLVVHLHVHTLRSALSAVARGELLVQ